MPLGLIRGITFRNCTVILDEAQNCTEEQMKTFVTRLGPKSKFIILGDTQQSDLKKGIRTGLDDIIHRLAGMSSVNIVEFETNDVVRHPLVKRILKRYDDDYIKKEIEDIIPNDKSTEQHEEARTDRRGTAA